MQGTNTVTVLVLCGTGSDHEPRGKGGISHFLEHMFFKGTTRRPTPQHIMQEMDAIGAINNAFTSHEMTGYFIKSGKNYFEKSLDIMADIYQNSLLLDREIMREQQVIVEERRWRRDTPDIFIWRLWENLLYGESQHAGRDVIGTEQEIRSFRRKDLVEYFASQYTAKNTAIIVAGNFDEPSAIQRITRLFHGVRDSLPRPQFPFREGQTAPGARIHFKEADQTHLALGFRAFAAHDKDRHILEVLEAVTGGSNSSRMYDVIRERKGLAYTVFSATQLYSNRGYFLTYAGVSHANAPKAISAMLEEYSKLADRPISAKELQRAKDHLKGTTLMRFEASNAVASFIGEEEMETGKPLTAEEVFSLIDRVSVADIRRVAKRLFRPSRLNLALIGPFKDGAKFNKLLK